MVTTKKRNVHWLVVNLSGVILQRESFMVILDVYVDEKSYMAGHEHIGRCKSN